MTPARRAASTLVAAAALALAVPLALSGCTGPTPEPTRTKTPTPSATAKSPGITDVTNAPGTGEGLTGAIADTKTTSCELSGDAWKVAGTATNPTGDPVDYRIYVSLLDKDSSTRALKEVDLAGVDGGASADWSADIPIAEKGLSCVLRVERYPAA